MNNITSQDIIEKIERLNHVIIELGCGSRKRDLSWIGIDVRDYDCVDLVGDVLEIIKKFPDDSVNKVFSFHFIEHINYLDELMIELSRVLKKGGNIEFTVPHFTNPFYYSDYTHKSFFGLYTFSYLTEDKIFKRSVPNYLNNHNFKLLDVNLVFKSYPPNYIRHGLKKIFEYVFNFNNYMKELYEELFCYLIPCYELRYKLKLK